MRIAHQQNLHVVALVGALTLATTVAEAGEIGHFAGGFLNIRDYLVPDPGIYGAVYNYFYTTDQINDRNGDKVKSVTVNTPGPGPGVKLGVDVHVDMYVVSPTLIWATEIKSLGIKYGALISPTFANANLDASLSAAPAHGGNVENGSLGVGDMLVQPFWLGKSLAHWDFSLSYGFYAPIGKYDTGTVSLPGGASVRTESVDNIGFGFWTQQIQSSIAWYPMTNKATAVVVALTYETNGKKQDFDLTPGDNLTFNWGISQFLPLKKDHSLLLEVGPAGYDTWQITDDSGSDANSTRDQVHAVGGQLGLALLRWNAALTFHGFYEFAAQNRFQGASFGISLVKKF